MRNVVSLVVIFVITIAVWLGGYKSVAFAIGQSEGIIPQSGDLCGGTGGNGEIVSVGNNKFTLKLNDDGKKGGGNLIVTLTEKATIESSTGSLSLSDLKKGDRVTLVGDNNRDGTFAADAVVVCSRDQENGGSNAASITVRNHDTNYKKVSGTINVAMVLLVGLIWFGTAAFLRLKKKKSLVYLLFFTIFFVYLYKVMDYTLLQFQSLLLLKHFLPDLMLNGLQTGKNVNLIPLATLTWEDVQTSLLNILLMIPFGFGLPFITNFRMEKVVVIGLLLSIGIEFLQLVTGFMANTSFRIADINDLIFNTSGVAIGYLLFVAFIYIYRSVFCNWKTSANPILQYIAERPQVDK